jgi:hypothetical protein
MRVSGHIPGSSILQRIEAWDPIFKLYGSTRLDICIMHRNICYEARAHSRSHDTFMRIVFMP